MAIYHINPKAKKESGVIVTGEDAKKVMEILHNPKISREQFLKSSQSLKTSLKTIALLDKKWFEFSKMDRCSLSGLERLK